MEGSHKSVDTNMVHDLQDGLLTEFIQRVPEVL
jgi:hypothetical protein